MAHLRFNAGKFEIETFTDGYPHCLRNAGREKMPERLKHEYD